MSSVISKMNKSSFELHSKERFDDEYIYKKMQFHMQESPKKVYMKDLDEGVELLYVDGWNKNKAYINPNGFPWINISLNRFDSKVVAENHHTVDDAGFGFVNTLLKGFEKAADKSGKSLSSLYTYKGEVTINGYECYKLYIEPPTVFKYINYTTKRDQKLLELSRRIFASDYLLKVKNGLSYTRTIRKGTKLIVPSTYAKKVIVYIDKKSYLPIVQLLYDDKGLLEKFEYKKFSKSPKFLSTEFTTECTTYGF
ncbi:MAG: DUF1571 domain-containing protein [Saprospiraceae bacterium]|nr:DUF1571 domain-containing protein [Saprospiraceae bacterium]